VGQLNDELSPFGLVVVGAHAQKGTRAEIQAKARSRGVNFAIVESASVKDGNDFNGIPHCLLFDHTGKCVYRGSPSSAEAPLRSAVGKALAEDLGPSTETKTVTPLVEALKKGQSPKLVLQKAIPMQKSADPRVAAEAKQVIVSLTRTGQKQVEDADVLKKEDPVAAYFQLQRVPIVFKGTAVETKANALLAELRRTRAVTAELQARPSLDKIKKLDSALSTRTGTLDPKGADFQRAFGPALKQMQGTLQQMKKSWPEARATQEAIEIGDKYGVALR
jgi:hypothetical protein